MHKRGMRFLATTAALALLAQLGMGTVAAQRRLTNEAPQKIDAARLAEHYYAPLMKQLADVSLFAQEEIPVLIQLKSEPAIEKEATEETVKQEQKPVIAQVEEITGTKIDRQFGYLINGFSLKVKRGQLGALRALPGVLNVQEVPLFYPTMNSAVDLTQATKVWKERHYQGEGMVVSVLDTGIDYNHPDLQTITDTSREKLTKAKVESLVSSQKLPGKYFNDKVPYGFNYADYSDQVIPGNGPHASQHGVHVSGIVGANGSGAKSIKGVAPEAQILAMKVFSDTNPGASGTDVIAALEDSVKLGADVVNLSLGSPSGFTDLNDGYARAVHRTVEAGVAVVIAAGNEGSSADIDGGPTTLIGNPDIGIVGTPSTIAGAISVAATENSTSLQSFMIAKDTSTKVLYWPQSGGDFAPSKLSPVTLRPAGIGKPNEFNGDYTGKVALIQRGELPFSEKFKNALDAGASGILVYNAPGSDGRRFGMAGVEAYESAHFAATAPYESGKALLDAMEAAQLEEIEVSFGEPESAPSPDSGTIAAFSSWGPSPNLEFKPELAAPGGNIYSTVTGDYDVLSGTSMASPHMAGATALLLQAVKEKAADYKGLPMGGTDTTALVKTLFENTAKPRMDAKSGQVYSPRLQGAGEIQIDDALQNRVAATVVEDSDAFHKSYGDIALGSFAGSKSFTVNLQNFGKEAVAFEVAPGVVLTQTQDAAGRVQEEPADGATLTADQTAIELQPGEQKTVTFTLATGNVSENWVEGYLRFESKTQGQPSLSMPYIGFAGDWGKLPIFDVPYGDGQKSDFSQLLELKGTPELQSMALGGTLIATHVKQLFGEFDLPLGNFVELDKFTTQTVGISPNDDGTADTAFPQVGLLRAPYEMRYQVLDADKKVVRTLFAENHVRKTTASRLRDGAIHRPTPATWDGKLPNPDFDSDAPVSDQNPEFIAAPEGQYYLRVAAKMTAKSEYQLLDMPIKVDVTVPELTVIENFKPVPGKDGAFVARVKFKDNEGGVGVGPKMFVVTSLQAEKPFESTAMPTTEPDVYDVIALDVPTDLPQDMLVLGSDYAFNQGELLPAGTVGNLNALFLSDYNSGEKLEEEVFIHSWEAEEEDKVVWGFKTESWDDVEDTVLQDPNDGSQAYLTGYEAAESVAKISINGQEKVIDPNSEDEDIFGFALQPNTVTKLHVVTKDKDDQVLLDEERIQLILDTEAPTLKSLTTTEGEFQEGLDVSEAQDGSETVNVIYVDDETKSVPMTVVFADNSFVFAPDLKTNELSAVSTLTQGVQKLDPTTNELKASLPVNLSAGAPRCSFLVADRAGNYLEYAVHVLPKSVKGDLAKIREKLEEDPAPANPDKPDQPTDPVEVERELKVDNLSDYMLLPQAYDKDEYIVKGRSLGLTKVVVAGRAAKITPPKDSADGYDTFEVPVKLQNGMNIIPVQGYYMENGEEKRFRATKFMVLYDTLAPTLELAKETTDKIYSTRYFTNEETARLKGVASDNTFGFTLEVDGNVLSSETDINTKEGTRKEFDELVPVTDGKRISIRVRDLFYIDPTEAKERYGEDVDLTQHEVSLKIPVVVDKVAPTIAWDDAAPQEGQKLTLADLPKLKIKAVATDAPHPGVPAEEEPPIRSVTYRLNGAEFKGGLNILPPGEYTLEAIAEDYAGNKAEAVRHFTVERPAQSNAPAGTDLRVQTDKNSGVTAFYYAGTLLNDKNEVVNVDELTFHADEAQPDKSVEDTAQFKYSKAKTKVWDCYFTDKSDNRVPVHTEHMIRILVPLGELKPNGLQGFHLELQANDSYKPVSVLALLTGEETDYQAQMDVKHFSYYGIGNFPVDEAKDHFGSLTPTPGTRPGSGSRGEGSEKPIYSFDDFRDGLDSGFTASTTPHKVEKKAEAKQETGLQTGLVQTGESMAVIALRVGSFALALLLGAAWLFWSRKQRRQHD